MEEMESNIPIDVGLETNNIYYNHGNDYRLQNGDTYNHGN